MALTVSAKNYSLINACIDEGDWTGSSPNDNDYFYKEGTRCTGYIMKASGINDTYIAGTWNLAGEHLHLWFMTTAIKEFATGQVTLYDGTNTGYYTVLTSTTYPGGWFNVVLDCDRSPTSGSQPTLTAITQIGWRSTNSSLAKNAENTWIDHIYTADGLIAYGDIGGTSPFDLDDILAEDENTTNGWGMIRKIGGVYFLNAALDFGDTVSTNDCDFADVGQVLVFEDRPVDTAYYGITVAGNATGATEFAMGTKSGTAGISGCTIRVASLSQIPKWFLDADDTNIDVFQLYGCQLVDHDAVLLPTRDGATPANREMVSTTCESGNAAVIADTCPVAYCNFISSTGVAIQVDSPTNYVSKCNFIACQTGVELTVIGSYTFTDLVFTSCTYDIENSANATTTDSYAEGNYDTDQQVYAGNVVGVAQSITGDGNKLTSISLYLRKQGAPTGTITVKLYTHTGTFGTDSKPTTPELAVTKTFEIETLGTSYAVVKIDLDDDEFFTLVNATKYCIAIEYGGGDSSNRLEVGYDTGGSHGGNMATLTGSTWTEQASDDVCFYVRTGGDCTISASGTSNPSQDSTNETGTPAGVTNVNNTTSVTFDKLKDNSEVRVYNSSTKAEIAGIEDVVAGSPDDRNFAWSATAGLTVDYVIHNFQPGVVVYETIRKNGYIVPNDDLTIEFQQRIDRNADSS